MPKLLSYRVLRGTLAAMAIAFSMLWSVSAYSTHDFDNDGLSNVLEEQYKTDIRLADTDKDGFLDGEEVYDLGTDPTMPTTGAFSELERVQAVRYKLFSVSSGTTIAGSSVYVKGVADMPNTAIRLIIRSDNNILERQFITDYRGVYSDVVDLKMFCVQEGSTQLSIEAKGKTLVHGIVLNCQLDDDTPRVVSGVTLGGADITQTMEFRQGQPISLDLSLMPGYELKAAFASNVFSSSFLADSRTALVSFSPIQELYPGQHSVTYYVIDSKRNIMYSPVTIPFTVSSEDIVSLRAELPLAQWVILPLILLATPLFVFLTRMMQRKG